VYLTIVREAVWLRQLQAQKDSATCGCQCSRNKQAVNQHRRSASGVQEPLDQRSARPVHLTSRNHCAYGSCGCEATAPYFVQIAINLVNSTL
jgi:hypothetical protein